MKIKRIILITILILLVLNFNSFATESGDIIVDTPDINVEGNTDNDSQEDNTNTGNENSGENSNTGSDNNKPNDNNNETNNNDNNLDSGNSESTDNNETDNSDNIGSDSNESTDNNVVTGNNEPNDNNNETNNNVEVPNENEPVEQSPVENEEPPVSDPIVNEPTTDYNTVIEAKSENANLRTLILDVEGLSPEFDKNTTEYYLIVDLTVEEIDIEAYPEDGKAIILLIEGNTDLQEGQNTIRIVVRAEAGNTKTYTINVTKTDDVELVNANLKNLSVKGFNFYPSFKNNIYGYTLTINEKVSQLEIIAETENEAATYEIVGNENLNEGDNLIKVIVTAQDGETKREYKINVFMDSKKVQVQETSKIPAIILLSFIGIAIIGTSIAISKKH